MEESLHDTSKLIEAYKRGEQVSGYTTILNLIEFPKAIELNLTVIFPSRADYNLALEISTKLLKIGKPLPAIDIINAATAINNGLKLVTKDRHFLAIKEVKEEFNLVIE
jgi:hypothetical protein